MFHFLNPLKEDRPFFNGDGNTTNPYKQTLVQPLILLLHTENPSRRNPKLLLLIWFIFLIKSLLVESTIDLAFQERHRFILDPPDAYGQRCPEVREHRACPSLPRCQTYRWLVLAWSKCLFPQHYEKCGRGYRARGTSFINWFLFRPDRIPFGILSTCLYM